MLQTIWILIQLRVTCSVNSIQYSLRKLPFIKRLFLGKSYDVAALKLVCSVFAFCLEIIKAFVGKVVYLLLTASLLGTIIGFVGDYGIEPDIRASFFHILLFFTVIGTMLNNSLLNTGEDEYCAIILLRMKAKNYALFNYSYFLIKMFIGLLVVMLFVEGSMGIPFSMCLLYVLYVIAAKLCGAAINLIWFDKRTAKSKKIVGPLMIVLLVMLLLASVVPVAVGCELPTNISTSIMIAVIVLGILSISKIVNYKRYEITYKRELYDYKNVINDAPSSLEEINARDALEGKELGDVTSSKEGFAYLNDLFVKRHKKLLWSVSIKITIVAIVIMAALIVMLFFDSSFKDDVNNEFMKLLPTTVFLIYMLNRGLSFTQALFINCDHSLLTYSFYKESNSILKLFRLRLIELIKINLLPALTISIGLGVFLLLAGGIDNLFDSIVLAVSIVALSILFSVHYMTLYYLLQPYNSDTKIKSPLYSVIKYVTGFIAYLMIRIKIPSVLYGIGAIVLSLLYCIIAFILVYRYAPRTFRIKN